MFRKLSLKFTLEMDSMVGKVGSMTYVDGFDRLFERFLGWLSGGCCVCESVVTELNE